MTMSIRSKLLAAFALNLVLMIMLGVFAVFQVANLKEKTVLVGNDVVLSLQVISETQESLTAYQRFQAEHLANADVEGRPHLEQEIADVEHEMERLFAEYASLPVTDEERALFDHVRATWPGFVTRTQLELLPASRADNLTTARQVFGELDGIFEDMNSSVAKLRVLYDNQAAEAVQAAQTTADFARYLILGITILTLLVAATLGYFISSAIVRNIGRLTTATTAIAAGNLDSVVDVRSGDELGRLASSFNQMTTNLRTAQAAVAEQQRTLETRVSEQRIWCGQSRSCASPSARVSS